METAHSNFKETKYEIFIQEFVRLSARNFHCLQDNRSRNHGVGAGIEVDRRKGSNG
ncbi:uncharacterized protein G2W53_002788 [Senna tora]|uniref:Uncharacterized protein n=1 Tax=Senna tora TaxID=362788 RepID=A0A834X944_9FABA|nr:uncharacterized protein G2W53_002788 [Senna tora]